MSNPAPHSGQLLLIIDFGYTMNETWLAYDEASDNEGCCGWR